jgi:hypothetical protein
MGDILDGRGDSLGLSNEFILEWQPLGQTILSSIIEDFYYSLVAVAPRPISFPCRRRFPSPIAADYAIFSATGVASYIPILKN